MRENYSGSNCFVIFPIKRKEQKNQRIKIEILYLRDVLLYINTFNSKL